MGNLQDPGPRPCFSRTSRPQDQQSTSSSWSWSTATPAAYPNPRAPTARPWLIPWPEPGRTSKRGPHTPAATGASTSRGKSERGKGLAHCGIRAGGRKALPYTPDKSGPSMASTGPSHGRSQSVADRAPQNSARKGKKSLDRFSASLFATSENGPRRGLERA